MRQRIRGLYLPRRHRCAAAGRKQRFECWRQCVKRRDIFGRNGIGIERGRTSDGTSPPRTGALSLKIVRDRTNARLIYPSS